MILIFQGRLIDTPGVYDLLLWHMLPGGSRKICTISRRVRLLGWICTTHRSCTSSDNDSVGCDLDDIDRDVSDLWLPVDFDSIRLASHASTVR